MQRGDYAGDHRIRAVCRRALRSVEWARLAGCGREPTVRKDARALYTTFFGKMQEALMYPLHLRFAGADCARDVLRRDGRGPVSAEQLHNRSIECFVVHSHITGNLRVLRAAWRDMRARPPASLQRVAVGQSQQRDPPFLLKARMAWPRKPLVPLGTRSPGRDRASHAGRAAAWPAEPLGERADSLDQSQCHGNLLGSSLSRVVVGRIVRATTRCARGGRCLGSAAAYNNLRRCMPG